MMEGARFKKKKKEARVYDTKEGTRCFMLCVSWHVFFFLRRVVPSEKSHVVICSHRLGRREKFRNRYSCLHSGLDSDVCAMYVRWVIVYVGEFY